MLATVLILGLYSCFLVDGDQGVGKNDISFPFNLTTQNYMVSFERSYPALSIEALLPDLTNCRVNESCGYSLQSILYFEINNFTEIHYDSRNLTTGRLDDIVAGNIVQNYPLSKLNYTYNSHLINSADYEGISFDTILPNGAQLQINFTITKTNLTLNIPRVNDNVNCSQSYLNFNCTCDTNHVVRQSSLKTSFTLANWTFLPYTNISDPSSWQRVVQVSLWPSGKYSLSYYENPNPDFGSQDVCGVANIPLVLNNNSTIDANFFDASVNDGVVTELLTYARQSNIVVDTDHPGNLVAVVQLYVSEFNYNTTYDPDFSILLPIGSGTFGDDNSKTGASSEVQSVGDGGGNKANKGLIIGLVVGIGGGVFVLIVAVIVVAVILIFLYKRYMSAQIQHATGLVN